MPRAAAGALLLTLFALAGCGGEQVYQPLDTSLINFRSTLVMQSTPQQPLPEDAAKALTDQLEQGLIKNPYLGPVITRAQFDQRYQQDFRLRDDYNLLSDTLSVLGLWDREQTARIGTRTDAEMLLSMEVFSVPCEGCPEGDQASVVVQMVDAQTGYLVWRATLLIPVDRSAKAVEAGLREGIAHVSEEFSDSLRPKWQRERFKNLDAERARRPRKTIKQEKIDRSELFHEAANPIQGLYP